MKEETAHDLFEGLIPQLQQLNKNLEDICKQLESLSKQTSKRTQEFRGDAGS